MMPDFIIDNLYYLKKMIINHDKSRIKIIHTIELTQGISIPEVNIPKFIPISAPAILTPVYMMYWKWNKLFYNN